MSAHLSISSLLFSLNNFYCSLPKFPHASHCPLHYYYFLVGVFYGNFIFYYKNFHLVLSYIFYFFIFFAETFYSLLSLLSVCKVHSYLLLKQVMMALLKSLPVISTFVTSRHWHCCLFSFNFRSGVLVWEMIFDEITMMLLMRSVATLPSFLPTAEPSCVCFIYSK